MIDVKNQQDLLLNVSKRLKRKIVVYAIGGTAMMFHGFKDITKDIDLVFTAEEDRQEFKKAAEELEYKTYNATQVYGVKDNQPIMLARGKGKEERFDLFFNDVIDFIFSENMKRRSSVTMEFDRNIILKIADPHDIILMKCATDRVKDKDDARNIMKNYTIDWNLIIEEAKHQVNLGKDRALFDLAEFVDDLQKIGTATPPFVLSTLWKLLEEQTAFKEETKKDLTFLEKLKKRFEKMVGK